MADEALACFQSVLDSVPGWIADLEKILETSRQRQNALMSADQPTRLPTRSPRSSTSSVGSKRRLLDEGTHRPQPRLTNSDALRLSQRKRKTASVCSARSGPSEYRSKSMVVVYFDGETQKQFEGLVRMVGTCRNAIRKGKLSAKLDTLSRSGSSSSQNSTTSGEETVKGLGTFRYTTTTTYRRQDGLFNGRPDGTASFDNVDGFLERAQILCERAAHQLLRDGECTPEVHKARDLLNDACHAVRSELPTLQKRAERAARRRLRDDEEALLDEKAAQDQARPVVNAVILDDTSFPSDGALEVDDDEVDDDDDDDGSDDGILNISRRMKLPPHLAKFQPSRERNLGPALTSAP